MNKSSVRRAITTLVKNELIVYKKICGDGVLLLIEVDGSLIQKKKTIRKPKK